MEEEFYSITDNFFNDFEEESYPQEELSALPSEAQIVESLNEEQKAAVLTTDGPILIIAGAGSGKTRVLTSKVALLITRGVNAASILALTFTKKAANEMRDRVYNLVGSTASDVVMGTFHSVFARLLRPYAHHFGFTSTFTILDEDDTLSLLKKCIKTVLFGEDWQERKKTLSKEEKESWKRKLNKYDPRYIAGRISFLKNEMEYPQSYLMNDAALDEDRTMGIPLFAKIYELYVARCKANNTLDFDDILYFTDRLLSGNEEAYGEYTEKFKYILVDEYQDTNTVQWSIINRLASRWHNVCIVGDDSQSIYSFRGAKIENILNFKKSNPGCRMFKLVNNYRSTSFIVNAANRLIANNANRIPKDCYPIKQGGEDISDIQCQNDREEADFVARTIGEYVKRHNRSYSDFAVLYRTNAQSRILEDTLMRNHIPYMVYSGTSFFNREEVKDTLAYCRLVVNHDDDTAFARICNKPARGISSSTLSTLSGAASIEDRSIYEVAKQADRYNLSKSAAKSVEAFVSLIDTLTSMVSSMDAVTALKEICVKSGLLEYYKKIDDSDGVNKANNIYELLNSADYFVKDQLSSGDFPMNALADYLTDIALVSNVDVKDDKKIPKVSLMTAHCAKGIEYPVVFAVGVEENLFPYVKESDKRPSIFRLEEERRLFYVAITRAMDKLYLTHCKQRRHYGDIVQNEPSRFIDEMS